MKFAVPVDNRVKIKEDEKREKYLKLSRELKKKIWNVKVTVILIIIGALGTIPITILNNLEKRLR